MDITWGTHLTISQGVRPSYNFKLFLTEQKPHKKNGPKSNKCFVSMGKSTCMGVDVGLIVGMGVGVGVGVNVSGN